MLQYRLCYGILIALIVVGLFRRGMLCQQNNEGPSSWEVQPDIQQDKANQNNEGPSSSHNFGPASLQHNDIQADRAEDSNFDQNPKVRLVQSNIQQDETCFQSNTIRAHSAKKSKFNQRPIAEKVTQNEANWIDLLCRIIALIAGSFLAVFFLWGYFLAGLFKWLCNAFSGS